MKVLYFDVEWANSKNKSICQIGLMIEDFETKDPIYPELNIYINPNDDFDIMCTNVHHINYEKVKNEPTFDIVWKDIEKYFLKSIVIGHNVKSADLDALVKNLKRYNLDIPEMYYVDTYEVSKHVIHPAYVKNYSLSSLCKYFDIDIDNAHDAFDDACACADLMQALVKYYDVDINDYIKKYEARNTKEFETFINSSQMRREINGLYGVIQGIEMDAVIKFEEKRYLEKWYDEHKIYSANQEVCTILNVLCKVLSDNIVTYEEVCALRSVVAKYIYNLQGSIETLATQQLQGILEGISVDNEINKKEIDNLNIWLYQNDYLIGHYPYDRIIEVIKQVIEDKIITKEENELLLNIFDELLNPIDNIKNQVVEINGNTFCLTGEFKYGTRQQVVEYIESNGGIYTPNPTKKTNYLVVGSYGSAAYVNGSYGSKIKKAFEKGITIIKEEDLITNK